MAVEALDPRTVRLRLREPDATFLANLAVALGGILSAEYAAALRAAGAMERIDREPIGTGPFSFAGFQPDVGLRYRAFADYWGGRQPVDTLVFSITPNAAVRLAKLKAGECHLMPFPNPADLAGIAADPALMLLREEELNIGYLSLNTSKPPFDDVRVRRAVTLAIDKEAIVAGVYGAGGTPARTPIRRTCGPTTRRSATSPSTAPRRCACSPRPASPRGSRPSCGTRRSAAPTARTGAGSPS